MTAKSLDERLAAAQKYYEFMRDNTYSEAGKAKFGDFVASIEEAREKIKKQEDEDERRL